MKLPLIEIRQRKGSDGIMTGANTQIRIDGKPLRGATSVMFSVNARGIAKATVELIGSFKVKGKTKLTRKTKK